MIYLGNSPVGVAVNGVAGAKVKTVTVETAISTADKFKEFILNNMNDNTEAFGICMKTVGGYGNTVNGDALGFIAGKTNGEWDVWGGVMRRSSDKAQLLQTVSLTASYATYLAVGDQVVFIYNEKAVTAHG